MEKTLSEYMSLSKNIDDLKFENKLKVAILSSFTLNGLNEILHVKCSELGIRYQSYVAGYNQYNQEFLNSQSDFYKFSPDVTFLILDIRNFLGDDFHFPYNLSDDELYPKYELKDVLTNLKYNSLSDDFYYDKQDLRSEAPIENIEVEQVAEIPQPEIKTPPYFLTISATILKYSFGGVINPPTPIIGSARIPAILPVVVVWINSSTSLAHAVPQFSGDNFNGHR